MGLNKIKTFLKIAEEYHTLGILKKGERDLGITLVFGAWLSLAFYTILFEKVNTPYINPNSISSLCYITFFEFSIIYLTMTGFFF